MTTVSVLKAMQRERIVRFMQIHRGSKAKRKAWRDELPRIRREYRALERAIEALSR
jgi:hypothetical protein